MQKEINIIESLASENYKAFKNRTFTLSNAILEQFGPHTLKLNLTVKAPPLLSVIPFRRKKVAAISLTRKTSHSPELIFRAEGYKGGYLVEEQIQKPSDLLNPFIFFGPHLKTLLHMYQVWKDARSFIDLRKMEIYLSKVIHLKSLPGQ